MSWKDEELIVAWRKVFRSPEGPLIAESLRRVVMELGPFEVSALQQHNGRRSFASELLKLADGPLPDIATGGSERAPKGRLPGRRIGPATT